MQTGLCSLLGALSSNLSGHLYALSVPCAPVGNAPMQLIAARKCGFFPSGDNLACVQSCSLINSTCTIAPPVCRQDLGHQTGAGITALLLLSSQIIWLWRAEHGKEERRHKRF
jgi:hypothetical protein